MPNINPKLLIVAGVLVLIMVCCGGLAISFNSVGHTTSDVLSDVNMGKALDDIKLQTQTLDHSLSIIDKQNNQMIILVAGIGVLSLVFAFAIYKIVKAFTGHQAQAGSGQVIMQQPYVPQMPHYYRFGDPGSFNYLMALPPAARDAALQELVLLLGAMQQKAGKHSNVKLLDSKTGKETRWS